MMMLKKFASEEQTLMKDPTFQDDHKKKSSSKRGIKAKGKRTKKEKASGRISPTPNATTRQNTEKNHQVL